MSKKTHALAALAFLFWSAFAWALPTTQQVESEVRQGHYDRAEAMMKEVVDARPGSARAHYVYAEILVHARKFSEAASEARLARQLDPKLGFTDPQKFRAFEQLLQQEQSRTTAVRPAPPIEAAPAAPVGMNEQRAPAVPARPAVDDSAPRAGNGGSGTPGWLWGVGAVVLAWLAWRALSGRRRAMAGTGAAGVGGVVPGAASAGPGGYAPNAGTPYGPPGTYGSTVAANARPGGGLLGTGMAVAGGVAGGMLLDEMLHHRRDAGAGTGGAGGAAGNAAGPFDSGSFDPARDDAAARQLEERPIDFGNGDDWGSDGGSFDVGSSDGGGGGGGDDWT